MVWFPALREAIAGKNWSLPPLITDLNSNPYSGLVRSRRRAYDVNRAAIEVYERTVWAWKSIETIQNHVGARPFRYRDPKTKKVIEDHPTYAIFEGSEANPLQTGFGLKRRIAAQLLISERGVFCEPTYSNGGDLKRVDILPPARTKPIPDPGPEMIKNFELTLPDGKRKLIPRQKLSWIKNDHPLDPYMSSTPMNAIGLTVQMDDLGRVINVSWMNNDGNISGVLALKGEYGEETEVALEKRFGHGPINAGKVSVVSADDLTYIDLAQKPRDMQYKQLAENAKVETLAGFGVPESQLGNAAGRTYDNAEAEGYIFWRITMLPILRLIAAGFPDKDHPELEPFFDVEDVEELQIPIRARKALALQEVAAGVRSIWSYAELAGITIESTAETRALWLPSNGRTALDQEPGADDRVALPPKPDPNALPGAPGQDPAALEAGPNAGPGKPQPPQPAANPARAAEADEAGKTKALEPVPSDAPLMSDVDEQAQDAAEARVAAALVALTDRWVERTVARLNSPKARKGTRHWQPDSSMAADLRVGAKVLDVYNAVDPDTWRTEAEAAVTQLLQNAGDEAAIATVHDLTGRSRAEYKVDLSTLALAAAVGGGVGLVATAVGLAAAGAATRISERLAEMDEDGSTIEQMAAAIRGIDLRGWARTLAATATSSAIESGRHAAVTLLGKVGWVIAGTWRSKRDDRVRPTHRAADGQTQPVGRAFTVGDAVLRHPRDPLGPVAEVLGCRCKVRWWVRRAASLPAASGEKLADLLPDRVAA